MNDKEHILSRLASSGMPERPYPDFDFTPQRFDDRRVMFAARLEAAGGRFVVMTPGERLDEVVRRCFPEARSVASTLSEVTLATLNPDRVEDPCELVDLDLAVVPGAFGVAENGAVWVPQQVRHKALYFGVTALAIVIPHDALVDTMHEAVVRPEVGDFAYGCFISGPSKTADIEQALVFGAHGPVAVTVIERP